MEIFKILLVDDEEDVRQAIAHKLDWTALGFEMVGEASNGQEALEMAEQLLPDVIMTDIKMPFMDGLELCRRAKKLLPGVRVAIFSGFDEFEYAREAISQQVEEYILKPINAEKLAEVFSRLHASLTEEIAQRRDVERLRRHYEESLPLMRQQLINDLLNGRIEPGNIWQEFSTYGLDVTAGGYCVAALRILPAGDERGDESRLMPVALKQLVDDTLRGAVRFFITQTAYHIEILFLLEEGTGAKTVADLLSPLFSICQRLLGIRLSIGLGGVVPLAEDIHQSYGDALSALEYQVLVDPGQCVFIGDIEPGSNPSALPEEQYIENLVREIKVGLPDGLEAATTGLVVHLKQSCANMQSYQIYLLELSTQLLKLIRNYRLEPEEARLDELLSGGGLQHFSNMDEMGRWLHSFCGNLQMLIRRERKDTARLLVDSAIDIATKQYTNSDLSLELVCGQLNVSPAYFSTLFKKETGQGFIGYLTALRLEKALELLASSNDKTYQIAEKIGYADANYFSYVFKKQYGSSPTKYKTDRMKGNEGP